MVRNGGSDTTCAGGFDRGVSGMSTNGAATTATTSPVFTSASYNFVAGDVNHWLYIKSGTNWIPGWYQIASVAANAATLTASVGSATLDNGGLNTAVGCATTASPTGATWTIDYSRSDTSKVTYTDIVINAGTNTNATSAANPFTINQVGNVWTVTGGTGFTVQRCTMVSLSGVTATFDRSLGTLGSTGGSARMGGAFGSFGMCGSVWQPGNWIYIKYNATAYSTTSTSSNVSGGYLATAGGTTYALPWRVMGFDVTPGDATSNRPTLKHGVSTANELITNSDLMDISGLIFDGNIASFNTRGVYFQGQAQVLRRCKFTGFGNTALYMPGFGGAYTLAVDCEFTACATATVISIPLSTSSQSHNFHSCYIHDNTFDGLKHTGSVGGLTVVNCIFATNKSGSAKHGLWLTSTTGLTVINCSFYNNGLDGVRCDAATQAVIINSVFDSNGQYGINTAACWLTTLVNNAFYNNTPAAYQTANVSTRNILGTVTLSGSPFSSVGSGDFSLNNTAGAGFACKAAAFPATFPGGTTPSKLDIGAAQSTNTSPATFAGVYAA